MADPVAALEQVLVRHLADRGYVLVNADMLAGALRLRVALEELIEDSCVEGPDCGTYESHKRAYAALAAIQEQTDDQ